MLLTFTRFQRQYVFFLMAGSVWLSCLPTTVWADLAGGEHSSLGLFPALINAEPLGIGALLFSMLVAVGLGAFHALEPGHGKTMVAAYLVGSRGTAWHALSLGLIVTASHTIGVYALGGVALFASHYILPEQLYPWLGFVSGALIAGTGIFLLGQALRKQPSYHNHNHHAHDHSHGQHEHGHMYASDHNHDHLHGHQPSHHTHSHDGPVSYGALLTLGVTGGLIPCPAALVVLLSAVAMRRITFGLLLIVAFSLGLAAVLVGIGLILISARDVVRRWRGEGKWLEYLPFLSPLVITPLGVVIALHSLLGTGLLAGVGF